MNTEKDYLMKRLTCSIAAVFMLVWPGVQAQEMVHQHEEVAPAAMSTGEVVKVDKALGRITLRHGPLTNLDMPGMTMAFRVAEPAMLDQVRPGDHVRFVADKPNGALTIVTLHVVP